MRALIGFYLSVGIVLLLIGFFATGPCPDKNTDVVSNVVFVVGWPVYLYDDVVKGNATAPQWLHRQACQGGAVAYRDMPPRNQTQPRPAEPRYAEPR